MSTTTMQLTYKDSLYTVAELSVVLFCSTYSKTPIQNHTLLIGLNKTITLKPRYSEHSNVSRLVEIFIPVYMACCKFDNTHT